MINSQYRCFSIFCFFGKRRGDWRGEWTALTMVTWETDLLQELGQQNFPGNAESFI
jgi:hypothetical protein